MNGFYDDGVNDYPDVLKKDFIIETSITRLTSSATGSIAFVFGRKNNTNEFDLFLSKSGSYLLRKLENDKSNKLIPWTTSSALNTQAYRANKIKIVKIKYFYSY